MLTPCLQLADMSERSTPTSLDELTEQIANVPQKNWPLYRRFEYVIDTHVDGFVSGHEWTLRLPRELILYCDVCKNNQRWRFQEGSWSDGRVYFGREQELHCKMFVRIVKIRR